jgi:hypothetical protein
MAAKKAKKAVAKKANKKPPIPDKYYDQPIYKRQPRDKDDVIVNTWGTRGKRTIHRGGTKFDKVPPSRKNPKGAMSA